MTLGSDSVRSFEERGHVVVPDLLTKDECLGFSKVVEASVSHRKRYDLRTYDQKSSYEKSFIQCQNLWEDCDGVRPLTFHKEIASAAAALLGVKRLRLWHDQALVKEAGGAATLAHQDFPYWPMDDATTITAWVPFEDANAENGCMSFLSKSHLSGFATFSDIFKGVDMDTYLGAPQLRGLDWNEAPVPAGGVSFHHGLTVHRAGPNQTDRNRLVQTMIFFADGIRRKGEQDHPCVARPGISDGAPIVSALTPLVWPQDGDLPEPPDYPWPETAKIGQHIGVYPPNKGYVE